MAETNKAAVDAEPTKSEPKTVDYIEYTGDGGEHGVQFLTSHTIPKGDALWKRNGVEMTKDVTWERDPMGPGIGQKGNHFLVPVENLPADAVAVLEKTAGFKRVTV